MVIAREGELEALLFPCRHATRRGIELRQHAPLADGERKILRRAAGERLTVDRAVEVDRQPVAVLRRPRHGDEARALLAQDADGLLHRGVVDRYLRPLDRHVGEIAHLHFRIDLERGAELELAAVGSILLFDARVAGDAQIRFLHRIAERLLHGIAQHFGAHLRPVGLRH